MPSNYVLLEKVTVGATAASVTFSGIPQTGYTDLKIVGTVRSNRSSGSFADIVIEFNSSTTGYKAMRLFGDGASVGSNTSLWTNGNTDGQTSNTYSSFEVYIPNYTSSAFKSWSADHVSENNASQAYSTIQGGLWSNSAAINSITIKDISDGGIRSLVDKSTFYLYGVAALGTTPVIAPYATGGDTIVTDGTYWYHAFKASGTFTPTKSLTCDVLVVAGGGAGGGGQGGGGGAGGVLAFASQAIATAQTATVGLGGAGVARDSVGNNGGNSQFGSLTAAIGGGGGGCYAIATPTSGGSGGGAGSKNTGNPASGAAGTAGQGNAGGSVTEYFTPYNGGGGGGAGGVGGSATSLGVATNGGAGVNSVTNWGSLSTAFTTAGLGVSGYIAGGGAGGGDTQAPGTGGSGGGGGGSTGLGVSGIANTGSGGQGSTYTAGAASGSGGSGLILVRYAV